MQFIISKELLEENIKILSEIPAKFSFNMISNLTKLQVLPEHNEENKQAPDNE